MLKNISVPIPEAKHLKVCEKYRVTSHVLKLYLRRCETNIGIEQFGFRNGFVTWEDLFSLNVLIQRYRDPRKVLRIDYGKAFHKVRNKELVECLARKGLDQRDINIIKSLHWSQEDIFRTYLGDIDTIKI